MLKLPALLPALLTALLIAPIARAQKTCEADGDCKKGRLCYAGACKRLKPDESRLRVRQSNPEAGVATLHLDGAAVGTLPFEGIVAAGKHSIRITAPGAKTIAFQGASRAGLADTISVTLEPAPPPPPAVTAAPSAAGTGRGEGAPPGRLFAGLAAGIGYGSAFWGTTPDYRPALGLQGGITAGVAALREPVWIDVGVAVDSTTTRIDDVADDFGDFLKLNLGVVLRVQFPIKDELFYIGGQLEPGWAISNKFWFYGKLHLALSFFFTEWFELRINPLGGAFDQNTTGKSYMATFNASGALVFRFLDF